ncbi:unnamed protein product [Protopolystoma xenopodis]|uniref:CFAP65-like ninth Ig-like domain-containing protein n=1 Tax=Protopolystoma xenopodis TaxID=117903 RepID=A0A3S5ANI4_9PLAT|nr:unnamed protein product [Protopolystoma xenopodis]
MPGDDPSGDWSWWQRRLNTEADSEEARVHLLLENPGPLDSEFVFFFPEDLELELEYWAESGEYTPEQLHQASSGFKQGLMLLHASVTN